MVTLIDPLIFYTDCSILSKEIFRYLSGYNNAVIDIRGVLGMDVTEWCIGGDAI